MERGQANNVYFTEKPVLLILGFLDNVIELISNAGSSPKSRHWRDFGDPETDVTRRRLLVSFV